MTTQPPNRVWSPNDTRWTIAWAVVYAILMAGAYAFAARTRIVMLDRGGTLPHLYDLATPLNFFLIWVSCGLLTLWLRLLEIRRIEYRWTPALHAPLLAGWALGIMLLAKPYWLPMWSLT